MINIAENYTTVKPGFITEGKCLTKSAPIGVLFSFQQRGKEMKDERLTERVHVMLTPQEKALLVAQARAEGRSESNLGRLMLLSALKTKPQLQNEVQHG